VIDQGRKLPKEVVECWPEIFGEVKLNVLPLRYLHGVIITFKDGKIWEVKITKEDHAKGWPAFESSISELYRTYENRIDNVDFRLDTEKIRKDIEKSTQRFLKKRKL
jgi:hypothetical protein